MAKAEKEGLHKFFKLQTQLSNTSMVSFFNVSLFTDLDHLGRSTYFMCSHCHGCTCHSNLDNMYNSAVFAFVVDR